MFQANNDEIDCIINDKIKTSDIASSAVNSDEYFHLVSMLPEIEANLYSKDPSLVLQSIHNLASIFKYKAIPDELSDQKLFLSILNEIAPFMNDDLLLEFGYMISNYYSHEIFTPELDLTKFASNVFMNTDLNNSSVKVIKPFIQFLSYASKFVQISIIENAEFYNKLEMLIGISQDMDRNVAYLLSSILENEVQTEILLLIPKLIDMFWKSKYELLDDTLIDIIRIIYLVIYWFDDISKLKEYFDVLLVPLKSLWNKSINISNSIMLIVQLPIPHEYIKMLLDSGGKDFMLNAIKTKNSAISEALYLMATLIKNGDDYEYMFQEVMKNAYFGKINTRIAAGMCIASYIYYNCDLVYPSFLEVMDDDDELNVANAISIILDFDNNEVNEALIKALYHLSFKFYERKQVHEFRETCDQYYIPEKINSIIDNPDTNESLREAGELFIFTSIRGMISFNEIYIN